MTEQRQQPSEQEVFDRLVNLFTISLANADAIKDLKADVKYNKKENPAGIPSARLGAIVAAAKLEAANNYEEFAEKNATVQATYEEFTNYND